MGAQFFATPFPSCEDIVCISGRLIQKGELGVCKGELGPSPGAFDVSGCLAAKPPVMVFEDLAVLEEIVRRVLRDAVAGGALPEFAVCAATNACAPGSAVD